MNYAVIKTGGKQHKVEEGEIISIEKLNAEEGEKVEFEEVLAIKSEGKLQVGSPVIDGAKVTGTVLSQEKDKKIVIITAFHCLYKTTQRISPIRVKYLMVQLK